MMSRLNDVKVWAFFSVPLLGVALILAEGKYENQIEKDCRSLLSNLEVS